MGTFLTDEVSKENFWDTILAWIKTDGLRLLIAFILLFLSFKIINLLTKFLVRQLEKKKIEKTYTRVIYELTKKGLKLVLLIVFMTYIGIEASSVAAIIASLGVGIGLALQGSLGNFAGGLLIIFTRTIRLGDFIETNNLLGTVEDIHLFYTHIVTPDNKVAIVPNGSLANGIVINYSIKRSRRVELEFAIPHNSNLGIVFPLIHSSILSNDQVLKTPEPFIAVSKLASNALTVLVRVWCRNSDYWPVYFALLSAINEILEKEGFSNPLVKTMVKIEK